MKTIARALLRWIINYFPNPQLEIGRGMLTELEELHDWEALEWAFGGIQFYLELKGVSMIKNILGISSVVILTSLASWLYAQHRLELSIGVLVFGLIIAALSQPKQAFWFALIFAMTLPITHLTQAYVFSSKMFHELTSNIALDSIKLVLTSGKIQESITVINSTPEANNGRKATYVYGNLYENTMPDNLDKAFRLFENQPVKLAMFGFPIAFLLTGLTLFLRPRFTKSPPVAI
jgi:hypothetical protein